MEPSLVAIEILNGIVLGVIYALVAAGLTLIFGMLDIPNFAHGAFYALGAYVAYTAMTHAGFPLALIAAPLAVGIVGIIIDALFIRRLARAGHTYQILFTLGLVLIVQEAIVLIWGPSPLSVEIPHGLTGGIALGIISFPYYRVFLVAVAALADRGGVDRSRTHETRRNHPGWDRGSGNGRCDRV